MPQLQINQGPQDALLYDNTRSYFTNVGYVRTSNFQLELRDVDPQNNAALGATVQFVIPKAADLLGPTDLCVEFNDAAPYTTAAQKGTFAAWVENVGYAMIDSVTFSVGSHDVEKITGDQLNIMNELMKGDIQRQGAQIGKTGRAALQHKVSKTVSGTAGDFDIDPQVSTVGGRLIALKHGGYGPTIKGQKLVIPLGLFFTKHPSQYFPLCGVAGCNDVRIAIKFRTLNELVVLGYTDFQTTDASAAVAEQTAGDGTGVAAVTASTSILAARANATTPSMPTWGSNSVIKECQLRCHYIHVTGPEATTLMNKEHVRLLKLFQTQSQTKTISVSGGAGPSDGTLIDMDLSFLHPVQELIITIRKTGECQNTDTTNSSTPLEKDQGAGTKNFFAYQGGGVDPNLDALTNRISLDKDVSGDTNLVNGTESILTKSFSLTLNGQERHPSLAAKGIDRDYLMNRLMPMLHSNTSTTFTDAANQSTDHANMYAHTDLKHLGEMLDRKEIYVYPFALNPEGANPSGAVNFSKVSHAKLKIMADMSKLTQPTDIVVDVHAVYYNWLQIKDGRALTSFA